VLACLAYVDLNPVRAAIAETPEDSDYTSVQRRIRTLQAAAESSGNTENAEQDIAPAPTQSPELYPFVGGVREGMPQGLPFYLADYLDLVNWTGRAVRDDKRGAIAEDLPKRWLSNSFSLVRANDFHKRDLAGARRRTAPLIR